MSTLALFFGATLGSLILFPFIARVFLWPMRGWDSDILKYVLAVSGCYVLATALYAYGDADELRAQLSFWEILATRANWLLYLPGAVLAAALIILRAKGRSETANHSNTATGG